MNDFVVAYRRYAEFEGRSDRKEFWYFVLFYLIVSAILSVIDNMVFDTWAVYPDFGYYYGVRWGNDEGPLTAIFRLASLIPVISVSVRRLHDINKSGWFFLFWFIPIVGWIFLLIWYCRKGDPISNRFGEPPVGSQLSEF
jgi:uncharacterized membrane protein YhaH (DUF805 family)